MKTLIIIIRNIIFISTFVLIMASQFAQAQSAAVHKKLDEIKVSPTSVDKKLALTFVSLQPVHNLLIIVQNQKGITLFLENQYRFAGDYRRTIDLQDQPQGEYTLSITADDENIRQSIHLD